MKKILVSVLAVAAMVACSTEHTVVKVENNEAIGFDTFVDKTTRAEDITTANIANFGVYASVTNSQDASALILTNEKVTKNGDVWGYTNTQHWVPGNSYNFTAIAPFEGRHWTYATGTQAQNGVIAFDNETAAGEQDLVFAYAERANVAAGAQPKVGLTFSHLLSKVAFKFTNGYAANDNMTLEVYGIKINNAVAEAKVAVEDGAVKEWEQTNTATFERTFGKQAAEAEGAGILAATKAYTTEHHYLLPIAQQYSITFTIDLYQAGVKVGQYVHTITPEIAFAKGGNYCISATLNETNTGLTAFEPIEFTVEGVNEWVDNGELALEATTVATADELATAIAEGGDIRLTQDINLEGAELNVAADNEANVDLNGYTLTIGDVTTRAAAIDPVKNYGKMTIANGKIIAGYAEETRRCIYNYGEMVIKNMEFVQTYDKKGAAINNEGKMTINNATVDAVYYSIWNSGANAELIINGGTYTTTNNVNLRDTWAYAVIVRDGAELVVNGGTFVGNHGVIAAEGGANVTLNGGVYHCTATYTGNSDWTLYAEGGSIRYNAAKCTVTTENPNGAVYGNVTTF